MGVHLGIILETQKPYRINKLFTEFSFLGGGKRTLVDWLVQFPQKRIS